jgi:hypothetical protein
VGQLLQDERKGRRSRGENFLVRGVKDRQDRASLNKFKALVYLLEEDFDVWKQEKDYSENSIMMPFVFLILGVLGAMISTLWVIHVLVFMFFYPPQSNFLNDYFIQVRLCPLAGMPVLSLAAIDAQLLDVAPRH